MNSLPAYAVQEAFDILLPHLHTLEAINDNNGLLHCNEMKQMDTECRTIQDVIDAFRSSLLTRKAMIHKRRNQRLPIYRLPQEVLMMILDSIHSPCDFRYYRSIQNLIRVSSHWRTTIHSASSFWSNINEFDDPHSLKMILERSKNGPLDIHVRTRRKNDFIETAMALVSRWRSFYAEEGIPESFSEPWLASMNLPLLESFQVDSYFESSSAVPTAVLARAPRLSELHIIPFSFPLESGIFSKLRSISMTAVVGDKALSCAQWYKFLSSAPQLRSIEAVIHGEPYHLEPHNFNVEMPKLERFELTNLPSVLIGTLLCSIVAPKHPKVTILVPSDDEGCGFTAMFPATPPPGSLLSQIRELSWVKGVGSGDTESTLSMGNDGRGELFSLQVDSDLGRPTSLFGSLIPRTGMPSLRTISFEGVIFFEDDSFSKCIPPPPQSNRSQHCVSQLSHR